MKAIKYFNIQQHTEARDSQGIFAFRCNTGYYTKSKEEAQKVVDYLNELEKQKEHQQGENVGYDIKEEKAIIMTCEEIIADIMKKNRTNNGNERL